MASAFTLVQELHEHCGLRIEGTERQSVGVRCSRAHARALSRAPAHFVVAEDHDQLIDAAEVVLDRRLEVRCGQELQALGIDARSVRIRRSAVSRSDVLGQTLDEPQPHRHARVARVRVLERVHEFMAQGVAFLVRDCVGGLAREGVLVGHRHAHERVVVRPRTVQGVGLRDLCVVVVHPAAVEDCDGEAGGQRLPLELQRPDVFGVEGRKEIAQDRRMAVDDALHVAWVGLGRELHVEHERGVPHVAHEVDTREERVCSQPRVELGPELRQSVGCLHLGGWIDGQCGEQGEERGGVSDHAWFQGEGPERVTSAAGARATRVPTGALRLRTRDRRCGPRHRWGPTSPRSCHRCAGA